MGYPIDKAISKRGNVSRTATWPATLEDRSFYVHGPLFQQDLSNFTMVLPSNLGVPFVLFPETNPSVYDHSRWAI